MNQSTAKERPCPDCGEMVRQNSLRCWNCGAFMNPDLEKKFMAMQASPSPVIYSEMPANAATSLDENQDDDDFELSMPISRPAVSESAPATEATPATEAEAEDAPPAQERPADSESAGDDAVPHSVATGGDALLDIAIQEERDRRKRQKTRRPTGGMVTPGGGLIIFCPYGCRVVVKEQHRGMTGKCPRCDAPFLVPIDPPNYKKKEQEAATEGAAAAEFFKKLLPELHLHVVPPEKLKLKADSLLKDFVAADVGMAAELFLVAVLAKKKAGGLNSKSDKPEDLRDALKQYFQEGKSFADLPLDTKFSYTSEELSQLKLVQPAASRAESIFHGIPVFGEGRIAVQLPFTSDTTDPSYLSMGITQFWEFAKGLEEAYGISGFGAESGIPMSDQLSTYQCHYSESLIKALSHVEFYKADPTVELEVAGWQCGACKTTVSEAARKKENLGGKSPKGIAKAKCPKCGSKMGENPLYSRKADIVEPSMSGD